MIVSHRIARPFVLLASALLLWSALACQAVPATEVVAEPDESAFQVRDGLILTARFAQSELDHEETVVSGGGSAEALPALERGDGFGLAIGARSEGIEYELAWQKTEHDPTTGTDFQSEFEVWDFNMRLFFRAEERLQPHVQLGVGFGCVNVEDGSVGTTSIEDAAWRGLSFRGGAGLTYFLSSRVSVFCEGSYRVNRFNRVEGVVDGQLQDDVKSDGVELAAGLTFRF